MTDTSAATIFNQSWKARREPIERPNVSQATFSGASSWEMLIPCAWVVEIVGVSCGAVNAAYTTFGSNFPSTFLAWIPAVPMAALAATELLKVPLAQASVRKRSFAVRGLALAGVVLLSGLAVENWAFGLERIVTMRLTEVNEARERYLEVKDRLDAAQRSAEMVEKSSQNQLAEFTKQINMHQETIKSLDEARRHENQAYAENLSAIRQTCLKTPVNDNCARDRSQSEDHRYRSEVNGINSERSSQSSRLAKLQADLQSIVAATAVETATYNQTIRKIQTEAVNAKVQLANATENNQIYRLAAMWFRMATEDVTQEQFSAVRWFFCIFGASLIASAGSIAAFIGYTRNRSKVPLPSISRKVYRCLLVILRRQPKVRVEIREIEKIVREPVETVRMVYVPLDSATGLPIGDAKIQRITSSSESLALAKAA